MRDAAPIFERAPFVQHLGIELIAQGEGTCETLLPIRDEHLQQTGVVHAGVIATLADHTAGGAATTLLRADQDIVSIEFKVNMLRAAKARTLICRATVLRGGRTISVTESEVFARTPGEPDKLVAKATVTLWIGAAMDAR